MARVIVKRLQLAGLVAMTALCCAGSVSALVTLLGAVPSSWPWWIHVLLGAANVYGVFLCGRAARRRWHQPAASPVPFIPWPEVLGIVGTDEAGPGPASHARPSHAWVTAPRGKSLDVCANGCGWRRLHLSAIVAKTDLGGLAYVTGAVVYPGGKRRDDRRWVDKEPPCSAMYSPAAMTTTAWCELHAHQRPSIHVVYDEFAQAD